MVSGASQLCRIIIVVSPPPSTVDALALPYLLRTHVCVRVSVFVSLCVCRYIYMHISRASIFAHFAA